MINIIAIGKKKQFLIQKTSCQLLIAEQLISYILIQNPNTASLFASLSILSLMPDLSF